MKRELIKKRKNTMKTKSKVAKFGNERKIVEIPKAVRDEFEPGEEVYIKKSEVK